MPSQPKRTLADQTYRRLEYWRCDWAKMWGLRVTQAEMGYGGVEVTLRQIHPGMIQEKASLGRRVRDGRRSDSEAGPSKRVGDLLKGGTLWDAREPWRTHPNRRPPMDRDIGLDAP